MNRPILIAGPTASGKSALALSLAERLGYSILNADALQVYAGWSVLTARPSVQDLARARHELYGHVPFDKAYSVGVWLRDIKPFLNNGKVIIVGGTGLYLTTLTHGLAEIPQTPADIRAMGNALREAEGLVPFQDYLARHDPALFARIDRQNGMRLQRAWEVHKATGRPLSDWQADTPPPLLPLTDTVPLVLDADRDWLGGRIDTRFEAMLEQGALDEARALLPVWDQSLPAARALGGPELIAHLRGEISLPAALQQAKNATRQFAKRQRTWFRSNMKDWTWIRPDIPDDALDQVLKLSD